jgi:hypothetical protein
MTTRQITFEEVLADKQILGDASVGDSWLPWRALLIAAMGEQFNDSEQEEPLHDS